MAKWHDSKQLSLVLSSLSALTSSLKGKGKGKGGKGNPAIWDTAGKDATQNAGGRRGKGGAKGTSGGK